MTLTIIRQVVFPTVMSPTATNAMKVRTKHVTFVALPINSVLINFPALPCLLTVETGVLTQLVAAFITGFPTLLNVYNA